MESKLFSSIGINIDPGILFIIMFIFFIVLFIIFLIQSVKYSELLSGYNTFMKGKNAESLEEEIEQIFDDIARLKVVAEKNRGDINKIIGNLRETYQRVGIVKYDAFKEMGGKLSFSIALLDDNASGFILNSVHSSDGCYVYTKEIVKGDCPVTLGDEEKKALMLALEGDSVTFD